MVWVIGSIVACVVAWQVRRRLAGVTAEPGVLSPPPRSALRVAPAWERPEAASEDTFDDAIRGQVQHGSSSWGAGRFAVELARRDHEEWLASSPTTLHPAEDDDQAKRAGLWGPVQSDVEHLVVEPEGGSAELARPAAAPAHPSVPRPTTTDDARTDRRARTRRRDLGADTLTAPPIPPHELARLTPAARRLYGLPPVAE